MVRIWLSDWRNYDYAKFAIWLPKKEEVKGGIVAKKEWKNNLQTSPEVEVYIPEKPDIIFEAQNKNQKLHGSIESDFGYRNRKQLEIINKTIKDLQAVLNQKLNSNLATDGIFWRKTIEALIKFQKENNIVSSWICDWLTLSMLFWPVNMTQRTEIPNSKVRSISNFKNTYSCLSLANFIAKKGYISKTKNSCGASVWNMLTAFWIKWLPDQGRDWHKWDEFLENRPDFVKVPISDPNQANPGAILVYDRWYGQWARNKYGHVEIATKDWFYYGKFKDVPGWSAKDWFTGYAYYYVWDNSSNNIW